MSAQPAPIKSLPQAIEDLQNILRDHPERDALLAHRAAAAGQRRKYPVFYLNHLVTPDDKDVPSDEFELPEVKMKTGTEADLAREIVQALTPLKMLNPVQPCLGLGKGTGTLVTAFGIPLNPEAGYTPAYSITLEKALSMAPPDPQTSGLMTEMRQRIELIQKHIPRGSGIYIGLPDMQGPFNLAHAVLGNEALTGPYTDPERFDAFMSRMADFWIAAARNLLSWIGTDWLNPSTLPLRIAECSVNLVSTAMYEKFILPHDLKLLRAFDRLAIHPCSGPHVFHATLKNIPNVVATEAGFIAKTAAGSISVDEALAAIGDRPILLSIGQELPVGEEREFIRRDLDRYAKNPRLLFSYTGMHWRIKDRPRIREIHRQLDEHWEKQYASLLRSA